MCNSDDNGGVYFLILVIAILGGSLTGMAINEWLGL